MNQRAEHGDEKIPGHQPREVDRVSDAERGGPHGTLRQRPRRMGKRAREEVCDQVTGGLQRR